VHSVYGVKKRLPRVKITGKCVSCVYGFHSVLLRLRRGAAVGLNGAERRRGALPHARLTHSVRRGSLPRASPILVEDPGALPGRHEAQGPAATVGDP